MNFQVIAKGFIGVLLMAMASGATANTECVITPTNVSVGKDDYSNYLWVVGNVTIGGVVTPGWWRLGLATDTRAQQRYSTAMMAVATGQKVVIAYDLATNNGCLSSWWISDDHINYVMSKP